MEARTPEARVLWDWGLGFQGLRPRQAGLGPRIVATAPICPRQLPTSMERALNNRVFVVADVVGLDVITGARMDPLVVDEVVFDVIMGPGMHSLL